MKTSLLLAVVLTYMAASVLSENPGARVRITKHALNGLVRVVKEVTEEQIKQLSKLAKKQRSHSRRVKIRDVKVEKFVYPNVELRFKAPNEIHFTSTGGEATVQVKLTMMKPAGGRRRGTTTITIKDMHFHIGLGFIKQLEGKLGLEVKACNVSIDTLDIGVDGFENDAAVKSTISRMAQGMKQMLSNVICPQLTTGITMVNIKLQQHDMTAPMDKLEHIDVEYEKDYVIDYSLVNDPKATDDYMEFDMRFCFHAETRDKTAMTFEPKPLVDKADNSRMFHFFLSDEVPNQVFRELHHHNDLKYEMPDNYIDVIKEEMKKHQEQMGWDIQDDDDIDIKLTFPEPPKVHFVEPGEKKHGLEIKGKVDMKVIHERDDNELCAATVHMDVEVQHLTTMEDQEDKPYPKVTEKGKISKLKVTSISDLCNDGEMTDEQKTLIETELKKLAQRAYDKKLSKQNDRKDKRKWDDMKFVAMTNAYLKFFTHTLEAAFDIKLDAKAILEAIYKDKPTMMLNFF